MKSVFLPCCVGMTKCQSLSGLMCSHGCVMEELFQPRKPVSKVLKLCLDQ